MHSNIGRTELRQSLVDGWVRISGCGSQSTVEYRAGNQTGKIGLLIEIFLGRDFRRVGVIVQGPIHRAGHGSDMGFRRRAEGWRGGWDERKEYRRLEVMTLSRL